MDCLVEHAVLALQVDAGEMALHIRYGRQETDVKAPIELSHAIQAAGLQTHVARHRPPPFVFFN